MSIWIIEDKYIGVWAPAFGEWFGDADEAWAFIDNEDEPRDGYRVVEYVRAK